MPRPAGRKAIDDPSPVPGLAGVAEHLKGLVEERRRRGEYPPDVAGALDAETAAASRRDPLVMWHRALIERLEGVERAVDHLGTAVEIGTHRVSRSSRTPVGAIVHTVGGALVKRQVDAVFEQLSAALGAVDEAMREMRAALSAADVFPLLEQFERRIAALEDRPAGNAPPEHQGLGHT